MIKILIVDDDAESLLSLARVLKASDSSMCIEGVTDSSKALLQFEILDPDVVILDLSLDQKNGVESGFELLRNLSFRNSKIIVLTGHSSVQNGVRALSLGAAHFIEKPPDIQHLLALIKDCFRQSELFRAYRLGQKQVSDRLISEELLGDSPQILKLREEIIFSASNNQAVFLIGETGTGKTLCASLIHRLSNRCLNNFVSYAPTFNTPDLVNSDLFGHEKGAFTGALQSRNGLLADANQGTFFLDEVDELPYATQIILLKVLQSRSFRKLGANNEISSDFRLISATNRKLHEIIDNKKLREDFYHRIAHKVIEVPALRTRVQDIPVLAKSILKTVSRRDGLNIFSLSSEAMEYLQSYSWPGNVREFQSVIEGAAFKAEFRQSSQIELLDLELKLIRDNEIKNSSGFHEQLQHFKLKLVKEALSLCEDNQVQAARMLGLDRSSLRRILSRS